MSRKAKKHGEKGTAGAAKSTSAGRGGLRGARPIVAGVVIASGLLAVGLLAWSLTTGGSPAGPKTAAIVDQLGLTAPNPEFVTAATDLLEESDYSVDYYSGDEVTVDFYETLPTHGYDFIVLRVHSGLYSASGSEGPVEAEDAFLALFTNEPYDQYQYFEQQEAGQIGKAYYREGGEEFFAVGPGFVTSGMAGRFDDTMIVMMGCDGLGTTRTAEAFIEKGAGGFISWSKPVSASHTDAATERLLQKLLIEELSTSEAVGQTAAEIGADPVYGAELRFLESGE